MGSSHISSSHFDSKCSTPGNSTRFCTLIAFATAAAMVMYAMTDTQFQAVYNVLSFSLASMLATTVYLFFRSFAVNDKFQSAC